MSFIYYIPRFHNSYNIMNNFNKSLTSIAKFGINQHLGCFKGHFYLKITELLIPHYCYCTICIT